MSKATPGEIIKDGKVYKLKNLNGFYGYFPDREIPSSDPWMAWNGGRIKMSLWQTIIAFFQKHKSDEVQVRLYYNDATKEWRAHAFPQRYPSGMTTRELPDHPNFNEDMALFPDPWQRMGSVHHHCSATAFQSGTDHTDEAGVVGLHLTVGHLGKETHDLHSRVCIRSPGEIAENGDLIRAASQMFFNATLSSWFELPENIAEILPKGLHAATLEYMLKNPVGEDISYPPRWDENLVRFQTQIGSNILADDYGYPRHSYPYQRPADYFLEKGSTHLSPPAPAHQAHLNLRGPARPDYLDSSGKIVRIPGSSNVGFERSDFAVMDLLPGALAWTAGHALGFLNDDQGRYDIPYVSMAAVGKNNDKTYTPEIVRRFVQRLGMIGLPTASGLYYVMPGDVQRFRKRLDRLAEEETVIGETASSDIPSEDAANAAIARSASAREKELMEEIAIEEARARQEALAAAQDQIEREHRDE
jgi:hypothetical protein